MRSTSHFSSASSAQSITLRCRLRTNRIAFLALHFIAALALLPAVSVVAEVHTYNSVVVFGDSLSDSGNVLSLSESKYGIPVPGYIPPYEDYTVGEFTDGIYSVPAARNYFGVWIQQLAEHLPGQPSVINSLDGGTNYAYGFATTGSGYSTLNFGIDGASVQVANIGQQITDYLAGHPHIDHNTLFVIWGGAVNLLNATSIGDVFKAAQEQTANIDRLIRAGATQILVPNLPPLGLVPEFNGSLATSVPATEASILFNTYLASGIRILEAVEGQGHSGLHIYELDVFRLMLGIAASPGAYNLTDVKHEAELLLPTGNPDTYLFWDYLHPTTRGHYILAESALDLLSN